MTWRRDDGSLFDPWLRLHERIGARIGPPTHGLIPHRRDGRGNGSPGSGWRFRNRGDYVFPGGLSPLAVDRAADRATYLEPNVWMIHDVSAIQNYEVTQ